MDNKKDVTLEWADMIEIMVALKVALPSVQALRDAAHNNGDPSVELYYSACTTRVAKLVAMFESCEDAVLTGVPEEL